jgi:hypothetical protein
MKKIEDIIKRTELRYFFIVIFLLFLLIFFQIGMDLGLSMFLSLIGALCFTIILRKIKLTIQFYDLYEELCKMLQSSNSSKDMDMLLAKSNELGTKIVGRTEQGLAYELFELIDRKVQVINNFNNLRNRLKNEETN